MSAMLNLNKVCTIAAKKGVQVFLGFCEIPYGAVVIQLRRNGMMAETKLDPDALNWRATVNEAFLEELVYGMIRTLDNAESERLWPKQTEVSK